MGTQIKQQEIINEVIIGGLNKVANPSLEENKNFWSISGSIDYVTNNNGVSITGDGYLYQSLNTESVVSGSLYMARIYVYSLTGTTTLTVGNAYNDASIGTVTLTTGWNTVRFTAGAVNVISIHSTSASDVLVFKVVEVREQKDLTISGQVINLDVELGDDITFRNITTTGTATFGGAVSVTGGNLALTTTGTDAARTMFIGKSDGTAGWTYGLGVVTADGQFEFYNNKLGSIAYKINDADNTAIFSGEVDCTSTSGFQAKNINNSVTGILSAQATTVDFGTITAHPLVGYYNSSEKIRWDSTGVKITGDLYTNAWADYGGTSTVVGCSSYTHKKIFYKTIGNRVFVSIRIEGTSDSTSTTLTLPFAANASPGILTFLGIGYDNSSLLTTPILGEINGNTATLTIYKTISADSWTASGTKVVLLSFSYEK